MATWTDLGSVGAGGDVMALAYFSGKFYAGPDNEGKVYRYDGGTTWTDVTSGGLGDATKIYALLVSGSTLYVATGPAGDDGGHVYSTTNGTSWMDMGAPLATDYPRALVDHSGAIYAGCSGGMVAVFAGGTSWTTLGASGLTWLGALCSNGGELYAAGYRGNATFGNARHWNGGTTWSKIGAVPDSAAWIYDLHVVGGTMYAGVSDITAGAGKVYSYDGYPGTSWTYAGAVADNGIRSLGSVGSSLYAGVQGNGLVFAFGGGTTWTSLGRLGSNNQVWSLATDAADLYGGGDDGHVYRYDPTPPVVQVGHAPTCQCGGGIISDDSRFTACISDQLDFELDAAGNLKRDYTPSSQCRVRLCARRGKWPYDAEVGSRFYGASMREAQRRALQWAKEALSPLVEDGSITTVEVPEVAVSDQAGEFDARVQIGLPTENPVTVVGTFRLVN